MVILGRESDTRDWTSRLRRLEAEALRLAATDLPTDRLHAKQLYDDRLRRLENSHSRSWFGDHASTYFQDFEAPPSGRTFNVEWGFIASLHRPRNAGWQIYSRDQVRAFVFRDIGEEIFDEVNDLAEWLSKSLTQKPIVPPPIA
jgi:hypothetical protein